jgi:lauroyl/myristoyl acyltransferase
VIAFFHTTWELAIARELRARRHTFVRAGADWGRDLGGQHVAWDAAGLRSLVRRVARGARCVVAADNFVRGSATGFFGTGEALNPAIVRLAALTGAPLVTAWPIYERGVVRFELGAPIPASTCAERPDEALHIASRFFEDAVRKDPAGWPRIVWFLERAVR